MIRTVVEIEPFHFFFLKTRAHMRGPPGAPRPGNKQYFFPSEAPKIDPKINPVFSSIWIRLYCQNGPQIDPKTDPKTIKYDLGAETLKTYETDANFDPPNH